MREEKNVADHHDNGPLLGSSNLSGTFFHLAEVGPQNVCRTVCYCTLCPFQLLLEAPFCVS